jgi:hypothetical protein
VSYAVLGFGGFLGIGNDHYPLPWDSLKYDTDVEGYRMGVTADHLENAPKYAEDSSWNWDEPGRAKSVDDYYAPRVTHPHSDRPCCGLATVGVRWFSNDNCP